MSFFGGGGAPQQPMQPDPLFAAQTEMEMYTVLFNKLTQSCFKKCASRKHKEPDLHLGEMSCIDRCVAKYMDSQELVGKVLQAANEKQAAQQMQMQQMQQAMGGA
ncbi:mitochondrial import inner membrane translocase subunit tim10 [Chaetoceros tenuissimus]|uniref:Mitochondrial import inner membrane translocase subunit n=1 Tax=Chaetoceros tenuissimus TaxID=426638 RepID=A0AAD3GYU7_9STRA|nr:mitochondrial import inner membrane translocase subunit tim10 [Chaetoceros tenuissimus]